MLGDEEDGDAPPEKRQQFVTFLKQRYSPDRPEELVAACQTVFNVRRVPLL